MVSCNSIAYPARSNIYRTADVLSRFDIWGSREWVAAVRAAVLVGRPCLKVGSGRGFIRGIHVDSVLAYVKSYTGLYPAIDHRL